MNSSWYVRDIEQLQQSFTDRFVDFDKVKSLLTTFTDPLEASYEDADTALQFKLITVYCSDKLRSKLKESDLLNFYKCFPEDPYHLQKATICASLFRCTTSCEQDFTLMKLNKSVQWNWLTDESITSIF